LISNDFSNELLISLAGCFVSKQIDAGVMMRDVTLIVCLCIWGMSEPMNFQMELSRKFEEQTVMMNNSDEQQ
jgi:hypothetical protein